MKYLALIQDGHEDRRRPDNHFGAWVVLADKPGPFTVAAIDETGTRPGCLMRSKGGKDTASARNADRQ
ncbi:MAG TPA: hypothetical protein VNF47_26720 [Streptosporangiaceae bacterium]|nr:hypothetical protein [Streptosporangiaceae bacterium]